MRWIWIDRFTEFTSRQSATAIKNVSLAEEHLHDLYPVFPIVPHSLIVEGMAQTSGILVGEARNFEEKVILAKIGRDRVCALYEPGVEIPSDFSGVLWVELDPKRRWHVELAKELKNTISHRAQAIRALADRLRRLGSAG